jgi:hypothetical protein
MVEKGDGRWSKFFFQRYRREGSNIFQRLKEAADGEVFFVSGVSTIEDGSIFLG